MTSESSQSLSESTTSTSSRNKCVTFMINNWFMLSTILGVIIGFAIAFGLRTTNPDATTITWISMIGDIYLRVLQLTILPLITSNILVVIASLEPKKNGSISLVGICYIILANLMGSMIGTACSCIIKPGTHGLIKTSESGENLVGSGLTASDIFKDIFYNFFPDNIIGVSIFQYRTEITNYTTNEKTGNPARGGTNMIGVLFCALVFGAAANAVGEVAKPMVDFFKAVAATVTKLMSVFLMSTPVGVCFMVAGSVLGRKDITSDFIQLGLFIITVVVGLLIQQALAIFALFIASGKNPFRILKYSTEPFLIAFATTSPAIAMGEMYHGLDKYGTNKLVSRFVIPVCAAMKGDGPAVFITSACIFVAQQTGVPLDAGKIIFIALLTFASSLAVPNIPSASMVLVVTVLSSIGVPSDSAAILFAMEWLLDRCRSGLGGLTSMYAATTTDAICLRLKKDENDGEEKIEVDPVGESQTTKSNEDQV